MRKAPASEAPTRMRLDKWLWAARFYKTRALAAENIQSGHVSVNGASAKNSKEIGPGDRIELRQGQVSKTVVVHGISHQRGPAPVAQQLYEETAESIAAREAQAQQRRLAPEPALAIAQGRPTKRDRRQLQDAHQAPNWDQRWSASWED